MLQNTQLLDISYLFIHSSVWYRSEAPSGISSIGVSTPESLDVRKKNIEDAMDQT